MQSIILWLLALISMLFIPRQAVKEEISIAPATPQYSQEEAWDTEQAIMEEEVYEEEYLEEEYEQSWVEAPQEAVAEEKTGTSFLGLLFGGGSAEGIDYGSSDSASSDVIYSAIAPDGSVSSADIYYSAIDSDGQVTFWGSEESYPAIETMYVEIYEEEICETVVAEMAPGQT